MVIRYNGITIDREKRTLSHGDATVKFFKARNGIGRDVAFPAICHLILGPGLSTHQLFDMIYGDDPDGGPLDGPHVFLIRFSQWELQYLNKLGLEWRKWKIAGVSFYYIVPKYQIKDPAHYQAHSALLRRNRVPVDARP